MTRRFPLGIVLVGLFLTALTASVHAGASADEWRRIRREALEEYMGGNEELKKFLGDPDAIKQLIALDTPDPNKAAERKHVMKTIKAARERCVAAMTKIGRADCRGAVDILVKLMKTRSPAEQALTKQAKELERKIEAIYARNKATLKKNTIDRNDMIEIIKNNRVLSTIQKQLNFLTEEKRKTSDALAHCTSQVDHMTGTVLGDKDWQVRMEVVQALAKIGTEPALAAVKGAVNDTDFKVRTEALEISLKNNLQGMEEAYIKALEDDWWQVRSVAIRAISQKKLYKAVGALIEALQVEDGRLTLDIDDALKELTGKRYYGDAELWSRWWAVNKEKFEKEVSSGKVPESARAAREAGAHKGAVATVSFYGIKTASKRIIFVLDVSGSMQEKAQVKEKGGPSTAPPVVTGPGAHPKGQDPAERFKPKNDTKIEVAKCELKRAICNLPEDAVFNIVFYNHEVEVYKKAVVKATRSNKEAAYLFIDAKQPAGNTNIHDSMKTAFDVVMPEKKRRNGRSGRRPQTTGPGARKKKVTRGGVDTIFFLTDGKPNAGKIVEPNAILAAVRLWNGTRKIQIHTVGVGDHDFMFLKSLAEQNGGTYVKR